MPANPPTRQRTQYGFKQQTALRSFSILTDFATLFAGVPVFSLPFPEKQKT